MPFANLEAQLRCALFERARRRPVLTEAGRAMLTDARRVDLLMRELTARAAGLTSGLEGEVSLAVDVMYPSAKLVSVLQAFAAQFPTVASGALARLGLADRGQLIYPFSLIHRVDSHSGPATQWLVEHFSSLAPQPSPLGADR
jgi:DNA-binding transcriptional LysR family regulator